MKYLVVDGHCDSVLDVAAGKRALATQSSNGHLDFPRMREGNINLEFMALFIDEEFKPYNSILRTMQLLDLLKEEIKKFKNISIILNKKDLEKIGIDQQNILISIEGGEALAGDLSVLRCFFDLGVRSIALTWNQRNLLADGCDEEPNGYGLSKIGQKVVQEMNQLGMLVDVSHLSEKSFWDVLDITDKPIIASHSCCRSLCNNVRNLSDEQLVGLAKNNGVIGINFCPEFLRDDFNNASIDDVIDHIEHATNLIGSKHVGLGSDFDGIDFCPQGLEDVRKVRDIITKLEERGFKEEDIANIMGNSFLRVLGEGLPND